MTSEPTVFRDTKPILGESLVWDPAGPHSSGESAMLWCDITAGLIHRSPLSGAIDGSADAAIRLPAPVASFHPAADGLLVVSLGERVVLADRFGAIVRELAHLHLGTTRRLNEGKVDPAGRWVTGSMNIHDGSPDGAYVSVDPGGTLRELRGGLRVSNGLEWSADGSRVYFTDTGIETIFTGGYTADGEIVDVEPWHTGSRNDGLTIDRDGCLWSALYGEGRVVRYDPDGRELASIDLPAPNVTSVAFGGPDLGTLYVCSARENLTEEQLEAHPLSGAVFALQTGSAGFAPRTFGDDQP